MAEQIRIGDIVVELRASYEAGEGCRVCIDSARLTGTGENGKPDSATIAMTVHLERPTSPFDKDVVSPPRTQMLDNTRKGQGQVDYLDELESATPGTLGREEYKDEGPPAGRGHS